MIFRFVIPGVGTFAVRAANKADAIRLAQTEVQRRGFPTNSTELQNIFDYAQPVANDQIQESDILLGFGNSPTEEVSSTSPAAPVGTADDTGDSGLQDLYDRGVQDASTGGPGGINSSNTPVGDLPQAGRPGGQLGLDVQSFPQETFLNALSARGFDPEGVLGDTYRQAYGRLAPAAAVGSNIGAVNPIGESPGALQAFFENNLGNASTLPLNVFQNLIANRAALSGDPATSQFFSPDLGTDAGRLAFTDVRDLARAAATNRLGGFAARYLPSNQAFDERFNRQLAASPGGAGNEPDFFSFARQNFGF